VAKVFLVVGTLNAGLCVMLGAFAAHKLKSVLSETSLATFQTGVQYHFYHSLALILLGSLLLNESMQHSALRNSGYIFIVGILFFSGSLYGLSFNLGKWLGPITPLGGMCFIVAWFMMAFGILKSL
jgi:uncharacterized membrane protein YgdD (TMEM256/DUF423 family)